MIKRLSLFIFLSILFIFSFLGITTAFTLENPQTVHLIKGAHTLTFELRDVNGSSALMGKVDDSISYPIQYNNKLRIFQINLGNCINKN